MITVIAKINNLIENLFIIEFKYEEGSVGNNRNDYEINNNDGNNNNNNNNDGNDSNNRNNDNNNNNNNSQFNKDINTRACENTVNYSTKNQN